jgi:hypothetical protein|tara:strand:- start:518 stop:811 length:294 start_codon:yes stop_codon:yes gene_type:complete
MSKQIIKKNGKAVLVNNKAHALLCKWSVENKQKNTDVLNAAIDLIFSTKSMKSSLLDKIFVKNTSDKIMKLNDKLKSYEKDINAEIAELKQPFKKVA